MKLALIVAMDEGRGIGANGDLPWKLPGEMKYFKRITTTAPEGGQNAVIMGRKTWESIPERFRPLPKRRNVVLSRNENYPVPDGVWHAADLASAVGRLSAENAAERAFVIGGSSVYADALAMPECRTLYITRVQASFDCDTHFPAFEADFVCVERSEPQRDGDVQYTFEVYERR